jgi:1,3-beta-galactosyl-N-acetylhexosamine phosphorylase
MTNNRILKRARNCSILLIFIFGAICVQAGNFELQRIQDDFEDGNAVNWEGDDNWEVVVVNGNHLYQGKSLHGTTTSSTLDSHFENFTIDFDVVRTSAGGIASLLVHRQYNGDCLGLELKPFGLDLVAFVQGVKHVLASDTKEHPQDVMSRYRFFIRGHEIAVSRRNETGAYEPVLTRTLADSLWLPGGRIALQSSGAICRFDNIILHTSLRTAHYNRHYYWNSKVDEDDLDWLNGIGANVVWMKHKQDANRIKDAISTFHDHKMEVQAYPFHSKPDIHKSWACHLFLPSRKVEAVSSTLTIDLLKGYVNSVKRNHYRVDENTFDKENYWHVWDMTDGSGKKLGDTNWSLSGNMLTLHDVVPGHVYSVSFVAESHSYVYDIVHPDARKFKLDLLNSFLDTEGFDIDIYRDTYFMYHFMTIENSGESNFLDWYGYGSSVNPADIEMMESEAGKNTFNSGFLIENGKYRSANDVPTDNYRAWMRVQQKRAMEFGKEVNSRIHHDGLDNGKPNRIRFFWGDGWAGMEPYLGMLDSCGFDEVVTSSNSEMSARRVMSFEGRQRRCLRQWWDIGNGSFEKELETEKRIFKHALRGMLFACPDGYGYGGNLYDTLNNHQNTSLREMLAEQFTQFEILHNYINRIEPYKNDIVIYVVNSWGELRSWPKTFTVNPSQEGLKALTDLPADVKFISLREIGKSGIPADADVLLCMGEPGSSWAGDTDWTYGSEGSVASILKNFVNDGGGFIGIDAPGVRKEEGPFVLDDLFGLEFDGVASEAAEKRHHTQFDRWRFQDDKRYHTLKKVLKLNSSRSVLTDVPEDLGEIIYNCKMRIGSESPDILASFEDGGIIRPLVTSKKFGNGKAIYIAGVGTSVNYQEFLKRAIYDAAGSKGVHARVSLDCSTPGAYIYYYPENRIFIAYNMDAAGSNINIKGKIMVEEADSLVLVPVYNGTDTLSYSAADMIEGIDIQVDQGEFKIWRAYTNMDRIYAAE